MAHYAVGVDFGTLSVRASLIDVANGDICATHTVDYPHAVMDKSLPGGAPLPMDWALQHPQDYLFGLSASVRKVLADAGVSADRILGIGVDFTSCSMVPVLEDGTPLCFLPEYQNRPHAYVKLWKHHAAQPQADRFNALAAGEPWLIRLGGKISAECLFPKGLELLEEDEEVYQKTAYFIEAGDWITWQLTGVQTRNACMAGYRGTWNNGYPSRSFLAKLNEKFADFAETKLDAPVIPLGTPAGMVNARGAELTGLNPGTVVSAAVLDAHVAMPAAGITKAGRMLSIIGTSACHLVLGETDIAVPGTCGTIPDGMMPGFFGFESGQSCVGDHFQWFTENCLPKHYDDEAAEKGCNLHGLLRQKVSSLRPGESGLLALDWWNGNRSILINGNLTGLLMGMTLQTTPEEIYRALIEATVFGVRVIIENYRSHGVAVDEIYATGGIAHKDPMMMQIYADVTGLPIHIAQAKQCGCLGSAIFAAVAAGEARGGYKTVYDAVAKMVKPYVKVYSPNAVNQAIYDRIYRQYKSLHDLFGQQYKNTVMQELKQIKQEVKSF